MIGNIKRDVMPLWYDLGFDEKSVSIMIWLHPKAFELICVLLKETAPAVKDFINKFNFPSFITPTNICWGFGEMMKTTNEGKQISVKCELPVIKNGANIAWDKSFAVSATLNLLFSALWLMEETTDDSLSQLLIIENMRTESDLYGGALSVSISPEVCRWINTFPDNYNHPKISGAMRTAFQKMWVEEESFMDRSTALLRKPKWINLDCPGDGCGLDPKDYYDAEQLNKGYTLLPHNTDSPLQQLTLLVGVAKLCQLVRRKEV